MAKQRSVAAAVALLVASACSQPIAERGRYRMASDPGSRHGFRYVQDTETGLWVVRDCELRVAEARALPEPLQDEQHGSKLAVSIFRAAGARRRASGPVVALPARRPSSRGGVRLVGRDLRQGRARAGAAGVPVRGALPSGPERGSRSGAIARAPAPARSVSRRVVELGRARTSIEQPRSPRPLARPTRHPMRDLGRAAAWCRRRGMLRVWA